jgi:phage terminase large subunit GpA-like protein
MTSGDAILAEIGGFDGATDILHAWRDGMAPEPALLVSEWADKHRMLGSRGSAEPGPWRTARTPYLKEIMDALSPAHPARRVVFMKGAQVGGTECGNNWIGFVIHHAPGPMLAVQPTTELAKRFSDQRIDPLIEETPALRRRVAPARSRDSGNRQLSKDFPGGQLVMTGANSAVGLRSMSARFLFLDEVDAYPGDVEGEGDPVALAEARSRTFGIRRKALLVSTPTTAGRSRIEREYDASDQRRFFVPCPHCSELQWLRFERLLWDKSKPETVRYVCEVCDEPFTEHHKTAMLDRGEWRATAEAADPYSIGFHISALYSPIGWLSWEQIARDWESAQGKPDELKTFKNTVLGETWKERGEAPEWQRLYDRREEWKPGTVPAGGLVLTAGIDVQRSPGRLEAYVWAWGRARESWLVDHIVVPGSPFLDATWDAMAEALAKTYINENGETLPISLAAVDSGDGTTTAEVYRFVRRLGPRRAIAIKGRDGQNQAILAGAKIDVRRTGKRIGSMKPWLVGSSYLKGEFYGHLNLERPTIESGEAFPSGFVHLPEHVAGEEVCKQLVAEEIRRVRQKTGAYQLVWSLTRERNEALDCRVYARAAAALLGVDRWGEDRWSALERQGGGSPRARTTLRADAQPAEPDEAPEPAVAEAETPPVAAAVALPAQPRRSGYFGGWR